MLPRLSLCSTSLSTSHSLLLRRLAASPLSTGHRSASTDGSPAVKQANKQGDGGGLFARLLGPESAVASPSFSNRWSMFAPAFATHVCLGAPYGWSAISAQLAREDGIVAAASSDWALDACSYPMSVMVRKM